jgi:hypothetical protein
MCVLIYLLIIFRPQREDNLPRGAVRCVTCLSNAQTARWPKGFVIIYYIKRSNIFSLKRYLSDKSSQWIFHERKTLSLQPARGFTKVSIQKIR